MTERCYVHPNNSSEVWLGNANKDSYSKAITNSYEQKKKLLNLLKGKKLVTHHKKLIWLVKVVLFCYSKSQYSIVKKVKHMTYILIISTYDETNLPKCQKL